MRILDLYCCAGGASWGFHLAGLRDIVGVDIERHDRYPFAMIQADVLGLNIEWLQSFDAIHASPPCQAYTKAQRIQGRVHADLIEPTRTMLKASGKPYVIENVPGAPLIDPIMLCGAMFPGLKVYRHRLFESNIPLVAPSHPEHLAKVTKMGRAPVPGEFMHIVGNFIGVQAGREAMGIDWMSRDELREAIPPAFTQCIGQQLLKALTLKEVA